MGVHWIDQLLKTAEILTISSKKKEDFQIQLFKSVVQKKYGNKQDAAATWIELIEHYGMFDPIVYIELAKYYEHDLIEYEKANNIVDRAIKRIEFKTELDDAFDYSNELADLQHRKERIMKKKVMQNG